MSAYVLALWKTADIRDSDRSAFVSKTCCFSLVTNPSYRQPKSSRHAARKRRARTHKGFPFTRSRRWWMHWHRSIGIHVRDQEGLRRFRSTAFL